MIHGSRLVYLARITHDGSPRDRQKTRYHQAHLVSRTRRHRHVHSGLRFTLHEQHATKNIEPRIGDCRRSVLKQCGLVLGVTSPAAPPRKVSRNPSGGRIAAGALCKRRRNPGEQRSRSCAPGMRGQGPSSISLYSGVPLDLLYLPSRSCNCLTLQ